MKLSQSGVFRYLTAVGAVGIALALHLLVSPVLGSGFPILVFLAAIMVAGWYGGRGPGILATALSLVAVQLLLAGSHTVGANRVSDLIGMGLFLLTGLLITWLNQSRSDAAQRAVLSAQRAEETAHRAEETARSLRDSEEQLRAAYEREKRIAETLQRSLLMTPAETQFDGLLVESFYEPAEKETLIGGDFFDAFALSGNKVALVVGDVSGKGLQAATHTAEIKYALRTILREHPHPATALVRLNNVVCESQELDNKDFGRFIALALAIVDPKTGEGQLSTAGSEPPLIVRRRMAAMTADMAEAAGAIVVECESESVEGGAGLPLCVESKFRYNVVSIHIDPQDTLLLLTDGITEARAGKAFLGYEGMETLARQAAVQATLRDMGSAIIEGARRFAGGRLQDDACILLARRV